MKKQNTFIKFLIFVLVLLSTIFCIVLTNQYKIVVFSIAFMGFVFSFLSCTKYLIFNKQEDKIVLLNSYFNDLITEKVKNFSLCKYKSCTISQRNTSLNKDSNLTNEPTQYANEFYLRIFTENGIIEPFAGNSSKEKIKIFVDKINDFFKYQDNNLILKEDHKKVLRYLGYSLILLSNLIGYVLILF